MTPVLSNYLDESYETCCEPSQSLHTPIVVTYQANPRKRSHFRSRSPTESVESRRRWAFNDLCALAAVHAVRPPHFFATLQWKEAASSRDVRDFEKRAFDALRRFVRRWDHELRLYLVHEIDRRRRVHAHCLIRTDLDRQGCNAFLAEKFSRFGNGHVGLTYFEPVQSVMAVSRYAVKDLKVVRSGKKEVLLFAPGVLRLRRHLGYFDGHTMDEWRDEGRRMLLPHYRMWRVAPDEFLADPWTASLFSSAQPVSV